ncbi:MAG: ferritin-like domain-containing protein [Myxococcales bacterium]|nr:MAG: ferritin-like domain-containing protein [Myxococcales bacterium]
MSARPFSNSLRLSLLASLGLVPLACGGTTFRGNEDDGGSGSGGTSTTAGTGSGGTKAIGGSGSGGSIISAGAGGTGSTPYVPTCTAPVTDPMTGIVTCQEGYRYRTQNTRCVSTTGDAAPLPEPKPPVPYQVDCTDDPTVCDQYQYGYCAPAGEPQPGSLCMTGCATDRDCGPSGLCRCEGRAFGVCTADTCDSDDDCSNGYHCASYPGACGSSAFACQTPKDECGSCKPFELCQLQEDGHRGCETAPVCGRPFLVEAEARVAPVTARGDWADGRLAGPRVDHLTSSERAGLAAHWAKLGQMEHASIAAFARFQLQLLALGAPPELVQACNQALIDETAHTQLCFGLASAYGGRAIGPGALDVGLSLNVTSLADVVELVLAEGCFGETSAALEALDAAQTAADPVVRRTYQRIAADEQRHAELAFHFVRWALERDRSAVAPRILAALPHAPAGVRDVAVPCLQALLEQRLAA